LKFPLAILKLADPQEAALIELKEETGYGAKIIKIGTYTPDYTMF